MPMGPKDLVFTEEAVLLMDLVKTFTWKTLYERSGEVVRADGRGMVTIEDVLAILETALNDAATEGRRSGDAARSPIAVFERRVRPAAAPRPGPPGSDETWLEPRFAGRCSCSPPFPEAGTIRRRR